MTMLKASLFGRSKRGDREEVKMELFNLDGSPYKDDFDHPLGPLGPMVFKDLDGNEIFQSGTFDVNTGPATGVLPKPGIKWPSGSILWESSSNQMRLEGTLSIDVPDDTTQNTYVSAFARGDGTPRMRIQAKLVNSKYLGVVMGLGKTGLIGQTVTYWGMFDDFIVGQRNAAARYRIWDTNTGSSGITNNKGGLELVSGVMTTASKYGAGVKFMTADPDVTTEVPKLGAGIFGRATETYDADNKGGMGMDFFTTPNVPGINAVPLVAFQLNEDQSAKFQKGVSFFNKTPPAAQPSAITSPTPDVTALKTAVDAIRTALTGVGITA